MSIDAKATYYDAGGIEVMKIIKAKLTREQYHGWLLGNVLKYACRMMHKHDTAGRDCEKALVYLARLDEELNEAGDAVDQAIGEDLNKMLKKG